MMFLIHLPVLLGFFTIVSGFHVPRILQQHPDPGSCSFASESTFQRQFSLNMALGDYFNNAFNSTGFLNVFSGKVLESVSTSRDDDMDEDDEDDNEYLGCSNIFSIDGTNNTQ